MKQVGKSRDCDREGSSLQAPRVGNGKCLDESDDVRIERPSIAVVCAAVR
jgi:hypothetical protein